MIKTYMLIYISQWFFEAKRLGFVAGFAERAGDGDLLAGQLGSIIAEYNLHYFVIFVAGHHEMGLFVFKPNVLGELFLRIVFLARLYVDFEFLKLSYGCFKVFHHYCSIEAGFVGLVRILIVFDHVHQVARPVHHPLLGVEILVVMRKFMSWPVLADIIKQPRYVPQCLVNFKIHHVSVFLTIMISLMAETILVIGAAAKRPVPMNSWRSQIIVCLPIFLAIFIGVAFCRDPGQDQKVVIVHWLFQTINHVRLLLFLWGSLFDNLLDIFSFNLLNLLYFNRLDQHWLGLLCILLFDSLLSWLLILNHEFFVLGGYSFGFFESRRLNCFLLQSIGSFLWLFWSRNRLLIHLLLIVFVILVFVIVFVNVLIVILIILVIFPCIFVISPRVLFFPVFPRSLSSFIIARFMISAVRQCHQSHDCH